MNLYRKRNTDSPGIPVAPSENLEEQTETADWRRRRSLGRQTRLSHKRHSLYTIYRKHTLITSLDFNCQSRSFVLTKVTDEGLK